MQDLPEILVLRHGETEWNRVRRFQGALDSALTDLGRTQAAAMGQALQRAGVSPATHSARTSPLGRARETARIALEPIGLRPAEESGLAEIAMGDWTGLTRTEIDLRWPGDPGEALFAFYGRCPNGEPLHDLGRRVERVLRALDGPTVLVTHGITLRALAALALGQPLAEGGRLDLRQGHVYRIANGRLCALDLGPDVLPAGTPTASPVPRGG